MATPDRELVKKIGRRAANKIENRNRLMEAGREYIGEFGLMTIGTREIGERAGFGHGTFYAYFSDVEELVQAIRDEDNRNLKTQLSEVAESCDDLNSCLEAMLRVLIDAEMKQPFTMSSAAEVATLVSTKLQRLEPLFDSWADFLSFLLEDHCDESEEGEAKARMLGERLAALMASVGAILAPVGASDPEMPTDITKRDPDRAYEILWPVLFAGLE